MLEQIAIVQNPEPLASFSTCALNYEDESFFLLKLVQVQQCFSIQSLS